ncbi:hypothetical protein [Gemmata sp. SH-PL17]|uniref:hypothetical protein n=1 Tax=Gemmata sp. SH-PL17 TaxID=1630693 RepID=UPI0012F8DA3E|nr:hypothetical protein [Gemmata sp. SH-PL17]
MLKAYAKHRAGNKSRKPEMAVGGSTFIPPGKTSLGSSRGETAERIKLEGAFILDPATFTHEHFREFLWAGLRLLAKEASVRGMPAEQKNRLLSKAFDCFYGVSVDLWSDLKRFLTSAASVSHNQVDEPYIALPESLAAFEENQPAPVDFFYEPDIELLNPDDRIHDFDDQ